MEEDPREEVNALRQTLALLPSANKRKWWQFWK
jgi:hypothetical protein